MGQALGKSGAMGNALNNVTFMSRNWTMGRVVHRLHKKHQDSLKAGTTFAPDITAMWSEANGVKRYRHTGACMMPHIPDQSVLHVRMKQLNEDLSFHRGDVVVMNPPATTTTTTTTTTENEDQKRPTSLLRRIAAVPGDVLTRRVAPDTPNGDSSSEITLAEGLLWVSKDNLEADGPDSSDFGPVSSDVIIGSAVRIGDTGMDTVLNSTKTLEYENRVAWVTLAEVEEVAKGFESIAVASTSLSPESEQVLKDSVGLFKAHENKTDEKKGDDKVFDETKSKEEKSKNNNTSETSTAAKPDASTGTSTPPVGTATTDNNEEIPSQTDAKKKM